jgi:hypothetical protein
MANLAVQKRQTGPNEYVYFVVDVDQNLSIATFANLELANQFAAAGDDSEAALLAARRENINATGGVRDTPTTPTPVFVPAVIPTGGGVTYETIPKDDPVAKQLNDANAAREAERVQNTRAVRVADPNYEGGFRFDVVAVDQINNNQIGPDLFAEENAGPEPRAREIVVPGDYVVRPNNNGSFDVVENQTGTVVASGLDESEANQFAQDQAIRDEGVSVPNEADGPVLLNTFPESGPNPYNERQAYDEDNNLNRGFTLNERGEPVFVGYDFVEPATQASSDQSRRVAAAEKELRRQQTVLTQQRTLNNTDWRVRLSLADNSDYLYNVKNAFILNPLKPSNGVIFPYTPQISTSYKANYSSYDLTHSNYRGYFYQNSYTDNVTITATFTAQDTEEANYLLAVIHFFRSVTKMFYGQSQNLGSPPPMCFLTGLGDYQFNRHPVLVTQFNYNLPADVDYIRAGSSNNLQLNQNQLRTKQIETTNNSLRSVMRLANALLPSQKSLPKDATEQEPTPNGPNTENPTYVPTKMEMVITLLPVQSRQQVSQEFNLQQFANGNQLRKGFW